MSWFAEVGMYLRFSAALRGFLRHTMTLDQAREIVQQRLASRGETFLKVAGRSIYGIPRSPYLALLRHARCEFGDLQTLVRKAGLEGALETLRDQGVYSAFEEFKGRAPIARPGLELPVTAHDFDNPFLVTHFVAESGGSTGVRTRVPHDLDQYASLSPLTMVARAAYDALDAPLAVWRGILPDGSGINNILYAAYYGRPPEKWFSPFKPFGAKNPKYTLATYYFCVQSRLYGSRIPFPEFVPAEQAVVVARWAAGAARRHGKSVVSTTVSRALRTSLAAQENGIDLTGVVFFGGGEPVSPDKARGIEKSGARLAPQYAMSEAGRIGNGCPRALDCTDVHLAKDSFAIIRSPFHITTLLTSAPKIMLNVEMDDHGTIEDRECGCLWGELGFTTHLRGIRSFKKLTVEGATLLATDMIRILEHDLPARFGGSPLDYQLIEQEDDGGLTRLFLVIDPAVTIAAEQEVVAEVMRALRKKSAAADAARAVWAQADSVRINRMKPIQNGHGKISPLHVLQGERRI